MCELARLLDKREERGGRKAMKTILFREHKHGSMHIITGVPDRISASRIIEKWSKKTIHFQVHKTLPAITWKVAESNSLVEALIESARLG